MQQMKWVKQCQCTYCNIFEKPEFEEYQLKVEYCIFKFQMEIIQNYFKKETDGVKNCFYAAFLREKGLIKLFNGKFKKEQQEWMSFDDDDVTCQQLWCCPEGWEMWVSPIEEEKNDNNEEITKEGMQGEPALKRRRLNKEHVKQVSENMGALVAQMIQEELLSQNKEENFTCDNFLSRVRSNWAAIVEEQVKIFADIAAKNKQPKTTGSDGNTTKSKGEL